MAKLKMIKYPKKPKQSASIETKERYLARVREIDKENAKRKAENKKSEELSKKIAGIRQK
jgi:predicted Holliday junction resolvase-like endonuclease